jgi:hypothetical protein
MTAATMQHTVLLSFQRRPRVLRVSNVISSFKPLKGSSASTGWIDRATITCAKGLGTHSVCSSEKDGDDKREDNSRIIDCSPDKSLAKNIYFDNKENISPVRILFEIFCGGAPPFNHETLFQETGIATNTFFDDDHNDSIVPREARRVPLHDISHTENPENLPKGTHFHTQNLPTPTMVISSLF